jgi:hypothetical protein
VHSRGLSKKDLEKIGITKIENLQETVSRLLDENEKSAVIPDGPYVVGMLK